jgi:hypothetical protein
MALVGQKTANFASFTGTPDAAYQILDFGFKSTSVKIVVAVGTLEVSLNKTDTTPHMILGVGQYDFHGLIINKLYVRNITAVGAQVFAWVI